MRWPRFSGEQRCRSSTRLPADPLHVWRARTLFCLVINAIIVIISIVSLVVIVSSGRESDTMQVSD